MIALKVVATIFLLISYIVMLSIMIILERDKPRNMIFWCVVFLLTSLIGGLIYCLFRVVFYLKRKSLLVKDREDAVYIDLISNEIFKNNVKIKDDFYEFNKMAFNANLTTNNNFDIFDDYAKFKENLIKEINSAKSYIFLEITKINAKDFNSIKDLLIAKANSGVAVKFVYDRVNNLKLLKEMKQQGIKVYRFSKHNTLGKVYSNIRNCISIDGRVCFLGNMNVKNCELNGKHECLNTFVKFKGDVVQDIDIAIHQDAIFASGKFIEYNAPVQEVYSNPCKIQYISNEINNNIELLLIKAISKAKISIQLQLSEFIPTESIMSLLKFAINSNIKVDLMVPLKTTNSKYYAYRAYAKELALMGANVYLYDGYIRFNAITIDDTYVLFGSYILDREHIANSLQNVVVIEDEKAIKHFNKTFQQGVENSYKIADAKYMLVRERFFKNFV